MGGVWGSGRRRAGACVGAGSRKRRVRAAGLRGRRVREAGAVMRDDRVNTLGTCQGGVPPPWPNPRLGNGAAGWGDPSGGSHSFRCWQTKTSH